MRRKAEGRTPKREIRNPKSDGVRPSGDHSAFGLRISFGLRPAGFGFPAYWDSQQLSWINTQINVTDWDPLAKDVHLGDVIRQVLAGGLGNWDRTIFLQ